MVSNMHRITKLTIASTLVPVARLVQKQNSLFGPLITPIPLSSEGSMAEWRALFFGNKTSGRWVEKMLVLGCQKTWSSHSQSKWMGLPWRLKQQITDISALCIRRDNRMIDKASRQLCDQATFFIQTSESGFSSGAFFSCGKLKIEFRERKWSCNQKTPRGCIIRFARMHFVKYH